MILPVLIADADPSLRDQLKKRLAVANISCDCAADGREALERVAARRYAVIVLDLALPRVPAEQILELIRQAPQANRPVVLVLSQGSVARSLDVDVVQVVLRKPMIASQLSALIESCARASTVVAAREATVAPQREAAPALVASVSGDLVA